MEDGEPTTPTAQEKDIHAHHSSCKASHWGRGAKNGELGGASQATWSKVWRPLGNAEGHSEMMSFPKMRPVAPHTIMCVHMHAKLLQSCLTLCDPSSVHGILRQECRSGLPCPSPGGSSWDWNPHLLCLLHWHVSSLPLAPPWILKVNVDFFNHKLARSETVIIVKSEH